MLETFAHTKRNSMYICRDDDIVKKWQFPQPKTMNITLTMFQTNENFVGLWNFLKNNGDQRIQN